MKKTFLVLAVHCLISTLSFAHGSDEPSKVVTSAESQFVMVSTFNDATKLESESEMTIQLTGNGCIYYGIEAGYAEAAYYGYDVLDTHAMHLVIGAYVDMCEQAGGAQYMLDPVFL